MKLSLSGTRRYASEELIEKLFSLAARATHITSDFELSLSVVSDAESKRLNTRYRKKRKATDVLSFGYYASVSDVPKKGAVFLGDLVLSHAILKQQAKLYSHSVSEEFFFLATHGFLHLLGYDHIKADDFSEMHTLTEKILRQFSKFRVQKKQG